MSGHATTTIPPPAVKFVLLQVPAPHVLLVAINFEKQMNSLPVDAVWEMHRVWKWFDDEPELERVSRLIGMLARMTERQSLSTSDFDSAARLNAYPSTGFAGLTRRNGRKPIIAACNGHAHGGGFEIVLSSDIVIASENADSDFRMFYGEQQLWLARSHDPLMTSLRKRMSPDSVIVTRAGIRQAWETSSIEHATFLTGETYAAKLMSGENAREVF
ncbi:enoyl-CoA hydratase [Histoplasma capsulatum var. duboisii H88]|uniref:Enoyl-CoA hydratase n=1 Tax=Ajellomyces capsulatus (strain H88) TaxID=544711 RepID=F0U5Z8_AJEC8|nr:enoyl-CoA hydratase [Histoplasma capsulatum var. duboisii H88]